MLVNVIADVVVEVRLLMLELLEVSVDISDITLFLLAYKYKRLSLFSGRVHRNRLLFVTVLRTLLCVQFKAKLGGTIKKNDDTCSGVAHMLSSCRERATLCVVI
jgi:hypothetical protein